MTEILISHMVPEIMSPKIHETQLGERKYNSLTEQYIHVTVVVAAYWYALILYF